MKSRSFVNQQLLEFDFGLPNCFDSSSLTSEGRIRQTSPRTFIAFTQFKDLVNIFRSKSLLNDNDVALKILVY